MTQPDLVSKLREVIARKRKWAEHVAKVCMAESNQFRAGDIIAFCDELESLLGREGQAALNECQYCNRGIERKLIGVHWSHPIGQEQFECRYQTLDVPPSTPIVPGTPDFKRDADVVWPVPGTAGLSAEQVQAAIVPLLETDALLTVIPWKKIADRLNALLGAATPAERWTCPDCGYDSMPYPPKDYHICPKCMVEFGNDDRKSTLSEREAKIRKSVLEEAAKHVPKLVCSDGPISQNEGGSYTIATIGCSCGWKGGWSVHIMLLAAERPAPAGEVKD